VKQAESHPVPNAELQGAVVSIIVTAGVLLRLQQAGTDVGEELVAAV
jgi:hypothetical protein